MTSPLRQGIMRTVHPPLEESRVWVVDLLGSTVLRRVLRRMALASMRWCQLSAKQPAMLYGVVHAPGGDPADAQLPAGVHRVGPTDLLSEDQVRQGEEWAFDASLAFIRGSGKRLFPEVLGVHLGQLNLGGIQSYLARYRLLRSAMETLLVEGSVKSCRIFSVDPYTARALHQRAAALTSDVASWSPERLRRAVRLPRRIARNLSFRRPRTDDQALRDAALEMLRQQGLTRLKSRILLASETMPIAQMLQVIEARLHEAGVGPVIRVDCAGDAGDETGQGSATVLRPGSHGRFVKLRPTLAYVQSHHSNGAMSASQEELIVPDDECIWLIRGLLEQFHDRDLFDAMINHLYIADALLEVLQPEIVVVGNDRWWFGQAFVHLARLRGIRSLCVQDGILTDLAESWWITADRIATSGQMLARILTEHGISPSRCIVVGQPRYDSLHTLRDPAIRRAARQALGLDQDTFVVLFATQYGQDDEYVRSVVAAILAVPEVRLLLRPHPSESAALHVKLVKADSSKRMSLHARGSSVDLVCAANALVTQHSTVALEATLLDVPVVTANFSGTEGVPYTKWGIATPAHSPQELTETLRRLVTRRRESGQTDVNHKVGDALSELMGPTDGRAGQRVAQLIVEMLNEPRIHV